MEGLVGVGSHVPSVGVGDAVVVVAEGCEVVEVGGSAWFPRCYVVDHAPRMWGVAVGEDASSVSNADCFALRRRC